MDAHRAPLALGRQRALLVGCAVVVVLVALLGALAVTTGSAGLLVAALLVAALGLGGAAALLSRAPAPPTPVVEPVATPSTAPTVREVDDLQGFFDSPPGSPTAVPANVPPTAPAPPVTPPAPAAVTPAPAPTGSPDRRRLVTALAVATVLLVVAAGTLAVLTDGDLRDRPAASGSSAPRTAPTPSAAPLTAASAGDLATASPTPGSDGFAAQLAFQGIVLEHRAVGATFSWPAVAVSSDGTTSVAHLALPTWNCLTATAPADPVAAGCTASLTEYADLPSPDLQVREVDGEFQLTGTFATYTRSNGSAPVYTGRSYPVTVQAGPDGREQDGRAPAAGELQLGGATTSTTADRAANTVQLSD